MKQARPFPAIIVTPKGERWIRSPHPWVYATDVARLPEGLENGTLADVLSEKGTYLGTGLFSRKSKIAVRILSSNANDRYDEAFFARRIKYALDYRQTVMGGDLSCCRLVFGEADGLPGLTVDRYGDVLVSQVLSYGMEQIKPMLYHLLAAELTVRGAVVSGVYERNDVALRELEGLSQGKGWYEGMPHADATVARICENGVTYDVDFENGQKTGFFLDQKFNRLAVARIAKGRNVLDCFTHTGSFALNAALGGAARVTAVDVSETALETARANARLNGMQDTLDFVRADVFDLLASLCEAKRNPYDLIVLDPPAFTKSRSTVSGAERGYREINARAMTLLPRGGYLATCSCSHFMGSELFEEMLRKAARDAGVQLRQVEARQQAPDHPILWNVPETDYLKFYIFQVI
ncbi:MAG TPA: class I SAM-dependent rRNA methyltransferase [Clostridia bacterium]|nr:class I SAM-dependent rRNA methyltransferase [Clostridia bacterium]